MRKLEPTECHCLLSMARRAIEHYLHHGHRGNFEAPLQTILSQPCGAFVSLHRGAQLRGCIGMIETREPLYRTVASCAVSAAAEDYRFSPVVAAELPLLEIEISVLSPLTSISCIEDIVVGQHGLLISQGFRRGLLLPQVATGQGWDRDAFLRHTCIKAGLPADAWRRGAEIQIFTADVFSERCTPQGER